METKDLQKKAVEIVDMLDRKFSVSRDAQLNFVQMVEEVGELAKDINMPRLRGRQPDSENLAGEFADVFLLLSKLADMHGIDIEQAVTGKIETIKMRHGL